MSRYNLTLLTDLYELTMMQGYYEIIPTKLLFLTSFTGTIQAAEPMP